jgi:sodium transport system ATP-binding protein
MIKTSNLTKIFQDKRRGEIVAVEDVNIECQPGRIFGLLGLNGAGKTTLMRLLSTSLKPTSGTAEVNGHNILKQPEKVKRDVGFLSGDTGLYPRLTAEEIVRYFARLNGMEEKKIDESIKEIFDRFDMNGFKDRRIDKLSQGMKQKVSIARTIIHDPEILILDEPTLGLDVVTSRNIIEFVKDSKKKNKCVMFSTHIMHEAEKLCDDIAIIHKGRILDVATLEDYRRKTKLTDLDDIFVRTIGE